MIKKWGYLIILLGIAWFLYPFGRVVFFFVNDPIPKESLIPLDNTSINDASFLNKTQHKSIIRLDPNLNKSVTLLQKILKEAEANGHKVIPFGARHSMGKQSLSENALHVDFAALDQMKMEGDLLRVQSGARWYQVLQYLGPLGLSVGVMQSNADFSVGGTLSVNAHGWQPHQPPVASSVEKISVLTADGQVYMCSRETNHELFRHVIGGYGLFGLIIEAWIKPVPNHLLTSRQVIIEASEFDDKWNEIKKEKAALAFGRLSVAPSTFFEQILLVSYTSEGRIIENTPTYSVQPQSSWARAVFRSSLNSTRGKELRHFIEKTLGGEASGTFARSDLLIEPVRVFANNQKGKVDILMEVFIPQEKLTAFISTVRPQLKNQSGPLLNVTIREICKDKDTALPYAKTNVFGLVFLFTIDKTPKAENEIIKISEVLFRTAIKNGGTFYLPYRNYAAIKLLKTAYPEIDKFLETKTKWDPSHLFNSGFWQYLKNQ